MTDILADNISIDMTIGEFTNDDDETEAIQWDLIDAKVVLSQVAAPNYVDMIVTPQPQYDDVIQDKISPDSEDDDFPNRGIGRLVGEPFELNVENNFAAVQITDDEALDQERRIATADEAGEDALDETLLFKGNLANISPIGNNLYEAIAYDPGQQAFNIGEESGSVINQKIDFRGSTTFVQPGEQADNPDEVEGDPPTDYSIEDLLNDITAAANFNQGDINIDNTLPEYDDNGEPTEEETPISEIYLSFDNAVVTVKDALNQAREIAYAEWWFTKEGVFRFGDPRPDIENYHLELIKDTSAGIQTPPYQSVRVIGSGIASSDGWASTSSIQDEDAKIVKEATIARPQGAGTLSEKIIVLDPLDGAFDALPEPVFKYINAEISTDRQAQNTALKIAEELAKQQASGKVTVVGMPEVEPFDGIVMPNSEEQPMGGVQYGVYSVTHKLNATDGFVTEIEVAGPTPKLTSKFDVGEEGDRPIIPTSIDRDVYTPDGERRAFGSGAGTGDSGGE